MKARTLVPLALLALVISRAPFFPSNPDWGLLSFEHCFVLSWPEIHANRQAADPDPSVPYGIVDVPQFTCYHGGSAALGHVVRWVVALTGTRTLLAHKIIGTGFTALFLGMLAGALVRLWPSPADRIRVIFPLVLVAIPPTFFLWLSLTPKGHYLESHLFHGLFLPFYVAAARRTLTWPWLVVAGLVGGIGAAYCPSHGIFLAILLVAYLAFADDVPWKARLTGVAISGGAAAVSFVLLFGNPRPAFDAFWTGSLLETFLGPVMGASEVAEPRSDAVSWTLRNDLLPRFSALSHDFFGALPRTIWTLPRVAALLGAMAVAAGATALLWRDTVRALVRRGPNLEPLRFMAIQGLLLAVAVVGFVGFRQHLATGLVTAPVDFLVPAYPPLFIGSGALLGGMVTSSLRPVRIMGWAVGVVACVVLGTGWASEIATNSRSMTRPEFGSCDSIQLTGYFYELSPPPSHLPLRSVFRGSLDYTLAYDDGQARCEASQPGDGDACAFWRYAMETAEDGFTPAWCSERPLDERGVCARAVGAELYATEVCTDPLALPRDLCSGFEGELLTDCLSGAWQGLMITQEPTCICALTNRCTDVYGDLVELAACLEQTAALLNGAPTLPAPSAPDVCRTWPRGWRGLCERKERVSSLPRPTDADSCEAVYLGGYAEALPSRGRLAYDQCLVTSTETYPWCAIGTARIRGETDCAWAGPPGMEGGQVALFWESLPQNTIGKVLASKTAGICPGPHMEPDGSIPVGR